MKQTIFIIGIILCVLNLLIGLILSAYGWQNVVCSTMAIIATTIFFLLGTSTSVKDGFKLGLILLFSVVGLIQFLLAAFMPSTFIDNWCLIAILLLLVIEVVILIITQKVSTAIR